MNIKEKSSYSVVSDFFEPKLTKTMRFLIILVVLSIFVIKMVDCIISPPYCYLQPDEGNCKAKFIRFFFNSSTDLCQPFIYGG